MDHWSTQRRQAAIEHLQQSGWLEHIQWLDEIDSTNSLARRLLTANQLPLPALLVADQQTAGRGRAERVWWSPTGCLMLSVVIGPESLPEDATSWPQLSLVTGLAAACAVESEVPNIQVQLKWPNDLYVNNRKLAGILVEAIPGVAMVIGIGINVAVDLSTAPLDVHTRACSLSQFSSVPLTLEGILIALVEQMRHQLAGWQAGQTEWWRGWSHRNLLSGCTVQARLAGGQQIIGACEGIDASGSLLLRDARQVHRVQSADILNWEASKE